MKKRSKLALLVSGIIGAAGIVICLIGAVVGALRHEQIYAGRTEDGSGYTYSLEGRSIDRVKLDVTDAKININGSSDEARIEIINFDENFYTFSMDTSQVLFKESPDVSSLMRFWESGFTFKGLRYILRLSFSRGQKEINVYLTGDEGINSVDIIGATASVSISNMSASADYNVSLEGGSAEFSNVKTNSTITVNSTGAREAKLSFESVECRLFNIKAVAASVQSGEITAGLAEVDITSGSANLDFTPNRELYSVDISATGKLTVNGDSYIDSFKYTNIKDTDQTSKQDGEKPETSSLTVKGRSLSAAVTLPADAVRTGESDEAEQNK